MTGVTDSTVPIWTTFNGVPTITNERSRVRSVISPMSPLKSMAANINKTIPRAMSKKVQLQALFLLLNDRKHARKASVHVC